MNTAVPILMYHAVTDTAVAATRRLSVTPDMLTEQLVYLLEHGDIEFRSWLVVQGALAEFSAEPLAYESFHRAIMGMGVALWRTPAALAASRA